MDVNTALQYIYTCAYSYPPPENIKLFVNLKNENKNMFYQILSKLTGISCADIVVSKICNNIESYDKCNLIISNDLLSNLIRSMDLESPQTITTRIDTTIYKNMK